MSLENLVAFEREFDDLMKTLPIWQLPVRPILTALHVGVDGLFHGSRRDDSLPPKPLHGAAFAARLSYLVPYLLNCNVEPTGLDAADALRAVGEADPEGANQYALVTYGHFCELMPEVHRGYYSVRGDKQTGFTLAHASPQFAAHEATDVILTELSLPFVDSPAPRFEDRYDHQASMVPRFSLGLKAHTLKLLSDHYRSHLAEASLLTEEGYRAALGVGREEFERFRAGLFAYADYCLGMAHALGRRLRREFRSETVWNELLENVSVHWKETFFLGTLEAITGLDQSTLDRLLRIFTVDFRPGSRSGKHAGDGFFPPLARLAGSFLFNPDLLRLFLGGRNVLYALNRMDRKRFDDLVSHHLEPELVSAAEAQFAGVDGLVIVKNHDWGPGEIDLLVYSPTENVALHVQAKATIPPEGARMVGAVEGRMLEGLEQLERLRNLSQEERGAVISSALRREVHGVDVIDVLLSRSCIGTENVWSRLGNVVPLNLTLLRIVVKAMAGSDEGFSLRRFAAFARNELERIVRSSNPRYVETEAPLGAALFRIPLLEFDRPTVWQARQEAWRA